MTILRPLHTRTWSDRGEDDSKSIIEQKLVLMESSLNRFSSWLTSSRREIDISSPQYRDTRHHEQPEITEESQKIQQIQKTHPNWREWVPYVDPRAFDHYVDFCLQSFWVHFLLLVIMYDTLPEMKSTAWHGIERILVSLLQLGADPRGRFRVVPIHILRLLRQINHCNYDTFDWEDEERQHKEWAMPVACLRSAVFVLDFKRPVAYSFGSRVHQCYRQRVVSRVINALYSKKAPLTTRKLIEMWKFENGGEILKLIDERTRYFDNIDQRRGESKENEALHEEEKMVQEVHQYQFPETQNPLDTENEPVNVTAKRSSTAEEYLQLFVSMW
jgi:hypothetical protein